MVSTPRRDRPPRPGTVRRQLAGIGRRPSKRLGQHFLADANVARRIVELAGLQPADRVVEIGPGLGALTDLLAADAGELWLFEVDAVLAQRLRAAYADRPQVHVVQADILRVDFQSHLGSGTAVVVANLPYNIGAAVVTRLLEEGTRFPRMVLMLQKEVAARLRAQPGGKDYGVLSVLTQFAAHVEPGLRVGPRAFVPPPRVQSEVVVLLPRTRPPAPVDDTAMLHRVVRTCFGQRRKQLGNSLRPLAPDAAVVLQRIGIDPARRAETLSLAEFAALSNALSSGS
jgi:16S rRNA (adenine1518-N6/adenine1519-N6)-dimethyltransferase